MHRHILPLTISALVCTWLGSYSERYSTSPLKIEAVISAFLAEKKEARSGMRTLQQSLSTSTEESHTVHLTMVYTD